MSIQALGSITAATVAIITAITPKEEIMGSLERIAGSVHKMVGACMPLVGSFVTEISSKMLNDRAEEFTTLADRIAFTRELNDYRAVRIMNAAVTAGVFAGVIPCILGSPKIKTGAKIGLIACALAAVLNVNAFRDSANRIVAAEQGL